MTEQAGAEGLRPTFDEWWLAQTEQSSEWSTLERLASHNAWDAAIELHTRAPESAPREEQQRKRTIDAIEGRTGEVGEDKYGNAKRMTTKDYGFVVGELVDRMQKAQQRVAELEAELQEALLDCGATTSKNLELEAEVDALRAALEQIVESNGLAAVTMARKALGIDGALAAGGGAA
jgi:hypothetical protein